MGIFGMRENDPAAPTTKELDTAADFEWDALLDRDGNPLPFRSLESVLAGDTDPGWTPTPGEHAQL